MEDKKTSAQKIVHTLFHAKTDAELGLPPGPATHMSKKERLETMEYAMAHPLHPNPPTEKSPPKREESDHVWDEKHMKKTEALRTIEHAWEHPFNPSA